MHASGNRHVLGRSLEQAVPAGCRRPAFGTDELLQNAPHFRDYFLFHEYFHGDDGRDLGASHQIGWTGLLVRLLLNQP